MEQVISLIIAEGIWAVLFCGLLVFELKDSRKREGKYVETIGALSDRLGVLGEVRSDTAELKCDANTIMRDTELIRSDTQIIRTAMLCADDGGAA